MRSPRSSPRRAGGRPARRNERGSMLAEAAIASPVFFLVVFAVMEFGVSLKDYLAMSSGSRAAVRMEATSGNAVATDQLALAALTNGARALSTGSGTIELVVVFKADGPEDLLEATDACLTGSVSGRCNRYVTADLSRPAGDFGCGPTSPDRFWCPTTRKFKLSDPPDYVGVYVRVLHRSPTGMFGATRTFTDQYVMRIEPKEL